MNKTVTVFLLIVIGALSLCALPDATVSAQSSDPAAMGPLVVDSAIYSLGNEAFTTPGLPKPAEVTGKVHYPKNWTGGPLPLILFLHGNHQTCAVGAVGSFTQWPCTGTPGQEEILNFLGYDYIANVLASHGYFVVSISANGINAQDPANRVPITNGEHPDPGFDGARIRARLIEKHLEVWREFNTTGKEPFGIKFVGKIDMQRIGLVGHSRGGEGIIKYFSDLPDTPPYRIKAIFLIAPTDTPQVLTVGTPTDPLPVPLPLPIDQKMVVKERLRINKVPFAVLLPYCDGDVMNLEGVHFYDDSRYNPLGVNAPDTAPKHTILVRGANHNFFNEIWTGTMPCRMNSTMPDIHACDDFKDNDSVCMVMGTERLSIGLQRTIATAYVCAFMRTYVGGESQFLPLLTAQAPPPPSVGAAKIYVSFHPPDNPFSRLDVNRLLEKRHLYTNMLGGAVTRVSLTDYALCGGFEKCLNSNLLSTAEPHLAKMDNDSLDPGLRQLRIGWTNMTGSLINDIPPPYRNISSYDALQFRASVGFGNGLPNRDQNFSVVLKDGTGATASVSVDQVSSALYYPPGTVSQKAVLNTVRVPLSAFAPQVNLLDIRSVEFRFDREERGTLLITDIAFTSAAHILLPNFSSDVCLKDDSSGAEIRFNTATGNYAFCCPGGQTMSGIGKVVIRNSTVTLTQGENELDRRIMVTIDRLVKRGTASLQSPSGSLICTITDRNTANNTCSCAPAP